MSPVGGRSARVAPESAEGKTGAKWTADSEDSSYPLDAKQAPPARSAVGAPSSPDASAPVRRDAAGSAGASAAGTSSTPPEHNYRSHWKLLLRKEGPDALAKSSRAKNIDQELKQIEQDHRVTQAGSVVRLSSVAVAAIRRLRAAQASLASNDRESDDVSPAEAVPVLSHADLAKLDPADLIARGFGIDDTTDALILQRITGADSTPTEVQTAFRATSAKKRTQEFHLIIAETLIQKGEPLLAEEVLYHCTKAFKEKTKTRVRQLHGLALAQGGSTERAIAVLEVLQDEGAMDDEGGGLLARCYKDLAARERNAERRTALLNKAHAIYREAFESGGRSSYYTGINTATMALLTGRTVEAIALADDVVVICRKELKDELRSAVANAAASGPATTAALAAGSAKPRWYRKSYSDSLIAQLRPHFKPGFYWSLATVGEAHVIIGDFDTASEYYTAARECAESSWVRLASTQRQLRLLLKHKVEAGLGPQALRALRLGEDAAIKAALSAARHGGSAASFSASDVDELGRAEVGRFQAAAGSALALHDAAEAEAIRKRVKAVLYDTRRAIERAHQTRSRMTTRARARRTSLPETFSHAKLKGEVLALELLRMSADDKALRGGVSSKSGVGLGAAARTLRHRAARAKAKASAGAASSQSVAGSLSVRKIGRGTGERGASGVGGRAKGNRRASDADSETSLRRRAQEAALTSRSGPFACMMDIPTVGVFLSCEVDGSVAMYAPGAEAAMRQQMMLALKACNTRFVYCSPCSLADLVFLETAHSIGCELYIILPVPLEVHLPWCAEAFMQVERYGCAGDGAGDAAAAQSAAAGAAAPTTPGAAGGKGGSRRRRSLIFSTSDLIQRLRALLGFAARVDVANDMSPEMTVTNRHYCSLLVDGLARKRAQLLGTVTRRIYSHAEVLSCKDDVPSWLAKRPPAGEYADVNGMTLSGLHLLPQVSCPWAHDVFDEMLTSTGLFAGAESDDEEDDDDDPAARQATKQALMRDSSDAALPASPLQVGSAKRWAQGSFGGLAADPAGQSSHHTSPQRSGRADAASPAGPPVLSGSIGATPSSVALAGRTPSSGRHSSVHGATGLAHTPSDSVASTTGRSSTGARSSRARWQHAGQSRAATAVDPSVSHTLWGDLEPPTSATSRRVSSSQAARLGMAGPGGGIMANAGSSHLGRNASGASSAAMDSAGDRSAALGPSISVGGAGGRLGGMDDPSAAASGSVTLGDLDTMSGASMLGMGMGQASAGGDAGSGAERAAAKSALDSASRALPGSELGSSTWQHPPGLAEEQRRVARRTNGRRHSFAGLTPMEDEQLFVLRSEAQNTIAVAAARARAMAIANAVAVGAKATGRLSSSAVGASLPLSIVGSKRPGNHQDESAAFMMAAARGGSASEAGIAMAQSEGNASPDRIHAGGIPRHAGAKSAGSEDVTGLGFSSRASDGSMAVGTDKASFAGRAESKDEEDSRFPGESFLRSGSSACSTDGGAGSRQSGYSRREPGRGSEESEVLVVDPGASLPIGFGVPRDRARVSIGAESIPDSAGRPHRYSDAGMMALTDVDATLAASTGYRSSSAAHSVAAADMRHDPRVALAHLFAVPLAVEHWTVQGTPFRVIVSPFAVQASALARLVTLIPREAVAAAHTTAPRSPTSMDSSAEVSVARAMVGLAPQRIPRVPSMQADPAGLTAAEIEAAAKAERVAKGIEMASAEEHEEDDEEGGEDEEAEAEVGAAKADASRAPTTTGSGGATVKSKALGSRVLAAASPPTSKKVSFLTVVSKATVRSALDGDLSRALEMLVPAFQQKHKDQEAEQFAPFGGRRAAGDAGIAIGEPHDGNGSSQDVTARARIRIRRPLQRRQVIAAPLFADVVNFSKLSEPQVLVFIENVLGSIANLIDSMPKEARPRIQQTWGDALYGVWSRVPAAGEFALMLSDLITKVPWHTLGLPSNLNIRISLHAAPVHVVTDPILRLKNYTGVHTSRAARIEPITPPGSVYCTQAFAAISEMLGVQSYECTYVGNVPLAKKYGMQPVFAVRWKSSSRSVPRALHQKMREKLKRLAHNVRKGSQPAQSGAAAAAAASKA